MILCLIQSISDICDTHVQKPGGRGQLEIITIKFIGLRVFKNNYNLIVWFKRWDLDDLIGNGSETSCHWAHLFVFSSREGLHYVLSTVQIVGDYYCCISGVNPFINTSSLL